MGVLLAQYFAGLGTVGPALSSFHHQDLLPSKTPGNLAPAGLGHLPVGDGQSIPEGETGPHKSSGSCPSSTHPVFFSHSPPTLPYPFLEVPMAPNVIPALNLIPVPHSQSRTPARSETQGLWAPASAQPLQPAPTGLSMGPPLAWMGCCLSTKEPTQQGPPGTGSQTENVLVSYLCAAPTACATEHTPGSGGGRSGEELPEVGLGVQLI